MWCGGGICDVVWWRGGMGMCVWVCVSLRVLCESACVCGGVVEVCVCVSDLLTLHVAAGSFQGLPRNS